MQKGLHIGDVRRIALGPADRGGASLCERMTAPEPSHRRRVRQRYQMVDDAMTEPTNRPSKSTAGARLLKALDAMSQTVIKGLDRLVDAGSPVPQPIPVRVSDRRRGRA